MPPQQAYAQQPALQQPQPAYAPPQQPYAGQPAQHGYAAPQGNGHPATGQYAPQPAPGGGYPQPDPFAQLSLQPPAGYPSEAAQRQAYAAPYDRFGPPPSQQHHDPHAAGHPGDPRQGYDPNQGHGQGYAQQAPQQHVPPQAEMQNWDLANYAPGQPMPAHGPAAGQQSHPAYDPRYAQPAWQGQPGALQSGAAYDLDRYAQPAQQQGFAPQPGLQSGPQSGYDQQPYDAQGPLDQETADQDFAYDDEPVVEKRRGPRVMVVVGALVGAILVGGGLAKGYQVLGGSGKDGEKPPLVRADKSEIKTKPVNAGGKAMENTDKKFLNRLETANGGANVTSTTDVVPPAPVSDPDAPRKVQTMVVNPRDGTITPQVAAPVAPPSGIPGMVVDGLTPAPLRNAPVTAEPAPTPVVRQAAPRVADLPLPKVKADATATPPPAPKKKVAVRDDLKAGTATTTAASSSGGYVIALVSTKSKDEALKAFANLHQTYPDLQNKVPDVREVDRGEKGIFHRLIAGPPSSKEAANELCKKLKGQGLKDCWVTAY